MELKCWFTVIASIGLISGCVKAARENSSRTDQRDLCDKTAIHVDSAFAVNQARRALGDFLSEDPNLVPFRVEIVTHGVIVSLVSKRPTGTGGGGLVWIDRDNGCPIVLRD